MENKKTDIVLKHKHGSTHTHCKPTHTADGILHSIVIQRILQVHVDYTVHCDGKDYSIREITVLSDDELQISLEERK